jgi:hypothetical protein
MIKSLIAFGNSKLPKTTAIFNLSSANDCPSKRLGLCEHPDACYAMKAERQYKVSRLYRDRQAEVWLRLSAEEFISQFLDLAGRKRIKLTCLRFCESGDLHSQDCLTKMVTIANALAEHGIQCYTYTARRDLDFSDIGKLVVNGSGFMVSNNFRMVPELTGSNLACHGNCEGCSLCYTAHNRVIEVKKH